MDETDGKESAYEIQNAESSSCAAMADFNAEGEFAPSHETAVEVEETELIEESAVGHVIIGEDEEYYLVLSADGPDVDIEKLDSVQILRNDDGTETVLLEIDELNDSDVSSASGRKQNDAYQTMEIVDIDKHDKIMQQLFGNPGVNPYQLGRFRRNRIFGTYSCPECDQTFVNTARLERHLAVHQICGTFLCPLCQKVYKYEYNLFYHWRRTCHEISELLSAEKRRTMDVNSLRSLVMKYAQKKAEEAPPSVMKIGINPNLLFKSDTFGLIDMQAPLNNQSNALSGVPCKQCGVKLSSSVMQWHQAMHRGIVAVDARSSSGEHFCSLCGQMFRKHFTLIKHWRNGCNEVQSRLPDARDLTMDDEMLKGMITDIMHELVDEYSRRFGGSTREDDDEVISSQDLFLSADKDKDLPAVDYQQASLSNREMFTDLDATDERKIVNTDEQQSASWNFENQIDRDSTTPAEPNAVRTKWSSTHGMVQCSVCSRTFVNITRLERHIASFHATSGSHPCILCGNRFKYDYSLLSHYRRSCPYTKLYIDEDKREQMDAVTLRRAVRTLAQKNLQLSSSTMKKMTDKRETLDTMPAVPGFPARPPYELLVMRADLPNGKSCPVCGVVFYGDNAVERHVKVVHPACFNQYFPNETRREKAAFSSKQLVAETTENSENASKQTVGLENDESPPTLVPEMPTEEPVPSEPVIRHVSRILLDSDGNQIFIDENGQAIELGEDEEVQIEFDDGENIQHLFETDQVAVADDNQTIILERNHSKYCYTINSDVSNSSLLSNDGTRFMEDGKQTDSLIAAGSKKARKQELREHLQHYDFIGAGESVKASPRKSTATEEMSKEGVVLLHYMTDEDEELSRRA